MEESDTGVMHESDKLTAVVIRPIQEGFKGSVHPKYIGVLSLSPPLILTECQTFSGYQMV